MNHFLVHRHSFSLVPIYGRVVLRGLLYAGIFSLTSALFGCDWISLFLFAACMLTEIFFQKHNRKPHDTSFWSYVLAPFLYFGLLGGMATSSQILFGQYNLDWLYKTPYLVPCLLMTCTFVFDCFWTSQRRSTCLFWSKMFLLWGLWALAGLLWFSHPPFKPICREFYEVSKLVMTGCCVLAFSHSTYQTLRLAGLLIGTMFLFLEVWAVVMKCMGAW